MSIKKFIKQHLPQGYFWAGFEQGYFYRYSGIYSLLPAEEAGCVFLHFHADITRDHISVGFRVHGCALARAPVTKGASSLTHLSQPPELRPLRQSDCSFLFPYTTPHSSATRGSLDGIIVLHLPPSFPSSPTSPPPPLSSGETALPLLVTLSPPSPSSSPPHSLHTPPLPLVSAALSAFHSFMRARSAGRSSHTFHVKCR